MHLGCASKQRAIQSKVRGISVEEYTGGRKQRALGSGAQHWQPCTIPPPLCSSTASSGEQSAHHWPGWQGCKGAVGCAPGSRVLHGVSPLNDCFALPRSSGRGACAMLPILGVDLLGHVGSCAPTCGCFATWAGAVSARVFICGCGGCFLTGEDFLSVFCHVAAVGVPRQYGGCTGLRV